MYVSFRYSVKARMMSVVEERELWFVYVIHRIEVFPPSRHQSLLYNTDAGWFELCLDWRWRISYTVETGRC